MTVPLQDPITSYQGNGISTSFPFGFAILDSDDLKVVLNGSLQTIGSQYSINGLGQPSGGAVVFTTAPNQGDRVLLYRDVSIERDTDYQDNGDLRAATVNADFDRLWMALQDIGSASTRAIQYPVDEYTTSGLLPAALQRASMMLGFDANGAQTLLPLPSSLGAGDLRFELGNDGMPGFKTGVDFTPDVTTRLPLSRDPINAANCWAYWDGGEQLDFTLSPGFINFPNPIPTGISRVMVRIGTTLSLNTPAQGSVDDDKIAWLGILGRVVDSVADLRKLDKTRYNRAVAGGYYDVGDGPGGEYWCDFTDTTTVEDGITVFVADDGGRWKLQQKGWIDVRQGGATGDGSTNDTVALARVNALYLSAPALWRVEFSAGTFCYDDSEGTLNWAAPCGRVIARGHVVLRYKGTGNAVVLDAGPTAGVFLEDFAFGDPGNQFVIEAPKSSGHAIFARGLNTGTSVNAVVRGAGSTSAGLLTNACVITTFNVQVAPYRTGWYDDGTGPAKPEFGMILTSRTTGEQTSYCTFINPQGAGCQYGFYLDFTLGNVFIGGDSESNTIAGMVLTLNALNNKIHGMDFEVNGIDGVGVDVACGGSYNEFVCDTGSNSAMGGFRFVVGSVGNRLNGGVHDQIAVDAGTGNYIGECIYGRGISGNLQIVDNGTKTSYGRNWQAQQQKWTYGPSVVNAVAVGASPFTYTNNTGMPQVVHVTGGTVSAAVVFRGATQLGSMSGSTVLSVGDSLSLTYSVAPTLVAATLE